MRLTAIFEENKEELTYLLCKILHYFSTQVQCAPHQRKKPKPEAVLEAHKMKLV